MRVALVALLIISLRAEAVELFRDNNFKCQMNLGLTNETLDSESAATINFSQVEFRPQIIYFFSPDFAVGGYYFQKSLLAEFNSFGIGAFLRYYYMGQGSVIKTLLENKTISKAPTLAPYIDLGGKRETLEAETVSVSFTGFDASAGVDWHWSYGYYFNLSFSLTGQVSGRDRSLASQSIMVGFGKALAF